MTERATDYRPLLEQALEAVEDLQTKLVAAEQVRFEPIAIVGIGCRFPGGVDDPDAFWRLLERGENAVTEIPANRWDVERYYSADPEARGTMYTRHGGFVERVDEFDAAFFGISPREARTLDPQQRLVLEVAWEALEHGGQSPTALRGSSTGVFVGIGSTDFSQLEMQRGDLTEIDGYMGSGAGLCFAAGRLSYVLGLRGPSLAVDTACSSSLVAVHVACQSLRQRECDLAIAGGVSVMLSPFPYVYLSRTHALAPDGRCKAFDAAADGFVRGEGCGMVTLKRLSDAVAAGDPVIAVVLGSAINQDGASSGLTVPNGPAQVAVISAALQQARLEPPAIGFVEAHGTGTSLGDPIEMNALCDVLGRGRPPESPLLVGSVKCNIGHLEAAAGIAGLIKAALVVQRGVVPPHLHFTRWNPEIDFRGTTVILPSAPHPWPAPPGERHAGVSAFGLSGTNAHVVLGEAPAMPLREAGGERARHIMRVTARTPQALAELGGRLAVRLGTEPLPDLGDACYSANTGRAHFACRAVVLGDTLESMRAGLESLANRQEDLQVIRGTADRGEPAVAFLFPGQGAQYAGMGRSLYDTQPVFRDALDRCDALLREHLEMPLLRVLYPAPGAATPIDDTRYAQPVMLAFEYALACLWQSWGIRPAALLGHSLGEYAAACVAGLLPLADALGLVAERGRLMSSPPAHGAMAAVFASEERVRAAMAGETGPLSVAALNGPENVVISGATDAVQRVTDRLTLAGVDVRPLNVPHAAHSPLLDPLLDEFERVVARASFGRAAIPIVSNVTGQLLSEAQQRDPGYWRRHAREAVRYADGVRTLHDRGISCFVEMGPHTTACGMAAASLPEIGTVLVPSLRKGREDWDQVLESLAMLYVRGTPVDWEGVDGGSRKRRVHLPTYPFQRERHWPDAMLGGARSAPALQQAQVHPILTGRLDLADEPGSVVWEGTLDLARHGFIEDHQVQGVPVVPATVYLELALAAGTYEGAGASVRLRDVQFHRPLLLRPGVPASVQVKLSRDPQGSSAVRIHSRVGAGDGWVLHATATLDTEPAVEPSAPAESLDSIRRRCATPIAGAAFYAYMAERGNQWGPSFQGMVSLWQGDSEALSLIEVPEAIANQVESYYLHPALADATGQVLAATIPLESGGGPRGGAFVGGGIEAVRLSRRPQGRQFWAHARIRPTASGQDNSVLLGDVTLMNGAGEILCVTEGCRFWYLDHESAPATRSHVGFYQTDWIRQPDAGVAQPSALGPVLIFADDAGIGAALRRQLDVRGDRSGVVTRGPCFSAADGQFQVRDGERDDYDKVFAALGDTGAALTVVFLWSLDGAGLGESERHVVPDRGLARCRELLYLIQAAARRPATRMRVWAVTAGAQPVAPGAGADPVQAMIWGLGRTIVSEHQELWGGLLDVDPRLGADAAAAQIVRALTEPRAEGEDQVAVRGKDRLVPRLRRFEPLRRAPFACAPGAAYLITGGRGGLGFEVARWLARRGARHLVLLGRSALPPRDSWASVEPGDAAREPIDRIRTLEAQGVQVDYAAVDVGDGDALSDFLAGYRRAGRPAIRGVVHAAGVMQYQPLALQAESDMRAILHSKVAGAWNLHREFQDALDFFVLFSSAASILPSPLVGSYAAANAFLDGLAHWRRAHGAPALSVNWGAWTQVGMGARFALEHPQDARDTDHAFSPDEGIAALERLVIAGAAQGTVLGVEWSRWRDQYPQLAAAPFMGELMAGPSAAVSDRVAAHRDLAAAVLRAAEGDERSRAANAYVAECVGSVLGLAADRIDIEAPISNFGFDSMMALELKNRIARELTIVIPLVRFLDGPSVGRLADLLSTELGARHAPRAENEETMAGLGKSVAPQGWDEGTI